ncbi:cytochrome P450 [Nocardia vaccinii]|nr:cytochrome P450 [Nocardia vaccinii]
MLTADIGGRATPEDELRGMFLLLMIARARDDGERAG